MQLIAKNARLKQPGLIIVDREVPGTLQNYLTPENQVPGETLPYPWETCMPMSSSWSHNPNAKYKPARKLIHLLADIVAKGGNFLLNIAPSADGDFDSLAYDRLKEIGEWMKVNKEAIYDSHPVLPYQEGTTRFTQVDNGTVYAIYLAEENEKSFPAELSFINFCPGENAIIEILGTSTTLKWEKRDNGCTIFFPESVQANMLCKYAWTLKIYSEP